MSLYIPIAGTHARWRKPFGTESLPWFRFGSRLDAHLYSHHLCERVDQDGDPENPDKGYWNGELEGLLITRLWDYLRGRRQMDSWVLGSNNFRAFLQKRLSYPHNPNHLVYIIAHSHGGQIATRALNTAWIRDFNIRLITVDMPVRRDWQAHYEGTAKYVQKWVHLHSGLFNPWRFCGSLRSGIPGPRQCECATVNRYIEGGHTGVLSAYKHMHQLCDAMGFKHRG